MKLLIFTIYIFIISCTPYNEVLKPDDTFTKLVQATRKGEFIEGNQASMLFVATYLNEFNSDKYPMRKNQFFFLDMRIVGQNSEDIEVLPKNLVIKLNDDDLISAKRLNRSEVLDMNISRPSQWGAFFLLEFPRQSYKRENFMLSFETSDNITALFYGVVKEDVITE